MRFRILALAVALAAAGCRTGESGSVKDADEVAAEGASVSQTLTGTFNSVACAGSCPGLQFAVDGQKIWVDSQSAQAFSSTLQNGGQYKLTGHYEQKSVFSESQGQTFMQLFVATNIAPAEGGGNGGTDQTLTAVYHNYACAGSCPGYLFESASQKIWVEAQSAAATSQTLKDGQSYTLVGHYEKKSVFDESQGNILMDLFVVAKITPADGAAPADKTYTGTYKSTACAGSCPGLSFTISNKKVWVDPQSAQPFSALLKDGQKYDIVGHYETKLVFSEGQGQVPLEMLVVKSLKKAGAPVADQTLKAKFASVACAGSCPGFQFKQGTKVIWVDAPSAEPFSSILKDGKNYTLVGHYESKLVFSESQGNLPMNLFVVKSIKKAN